MSGGSLRSSSITSFARAPPRRRRSPDLSAGRASLAFSMPLGLTFAFMSGRPGPPFSRAISSPNPATIRRSSAPSSKCFDTRLFSSAGESASMSSGGDIPPSSQKTADSGILPSPYELTRRSYRPTPSRPTPGLLPLLPVIWPFFAGSPGAAPTGAAARPRAVIRARERFQGDRRQIRNFGGERHGGGGGAAPRRSDRKLAKQPRVSVSARAISTS